MNDESMYIDGTYSENNPEFNDGESKRKADSLVRLIKDSPAELSDINSVLDYGCGGGGLITELCDKLPLVNRAMGIDLNHEAIDYAISNGRESDILRFKSGSLDDVDDEYDLISVVHVLEHIKDWDNFLLSIKEKADYVYFSVPIEASVWMTFRKNVLLNHKYA